VEDVGDGDESAGSGKGGKAVDCFKIKSSVKSFVVACPDAATKVTHFSLLGLFLFLLDYVLNHIAIIILIIITSCMATQLTPAAGEMAGGNYQLS